MQIAFAFQCCMQSRFCVCFLHRLLCFLPFKIIKITRHCSRRFVTKLSRTFSCGHKRAPSGFSERLQLRQHLGCQHPVPLSCEVHFIPAAPSSCQMHRYPIHEPTRMLLFSARTRTRVRAHTHTHTHRSGQVPRQCSLSEQALFHSWCKEFENVFLAVDGNLARRKK
jgi:hypothetical protein